MFAATYQCRFFVDRGEQLVDLSFLASSPLANFALVGIQSVNMLLGGDNVASSSE